MSEAAGVSRRIFLHRFAVEASIGIHEFERTAPQRLLVSVELWLDDLPADDRHDDAIDQVLDYDFLRQSIRDLMCGRHFNLQETLAREILDLCRARAEVRAVRVRTEKPDVYPDCEAVGVELCYPAMRPVNW